jgi:hypothetical protein
MFVEAAQALFDTWSGHRDFAGVAALEILRANPG